MKKNVGNTDKIIRIVLAFVFAALYLTGIISGTLGIVLTVLAVIFLLTSLVGTCPIYSILGISSCKVAAKE